MEWEREAAPRSQVGELGSQGVLDRRRDARLVADDAPCVSGRGNCATLVEPSAPSSMPGAVGAGDGAGGCNSTASSESGSDSESDLATESS